MFKIYIYINITLIHDSILNELLQSRQQKLSISG